MPLQAGHNELLKRMKRLYTVESFKEIVAELREKVPGITITTDIIVGFPEESEEEFEATLTAMREIQFDLAYMFIYSPRPGTPAADLPQLSYPVKLARLHRLQEQQKEISLAMNAPYVGRELEVLVEGPSPKDASVMQGYSREWKMVHFPAAGHRAGRLAKVRIESSHLWGLRGSLAVSD